MTRISLSAIVALFVLNCISMSSLAGVTTQVLIAKTRAALYRQPNLMDFEVGDIKASDPASEAGHMMSALSTSGIDNADPANSFTLTINTSIDWWISPDGSQGWALAAGTQGSTVSPARVTAGLVASKSALLFYQFSVDELSSYHEKRFYRTTGSEDVQSSTHEQILAGHTRIVNGQIGTLGGFGNGTNKTRSLVTFAIGASLPGLITNPYMATESNVPTDAAIYTIIGMIEENISSGTTQPTDVAGAFLTTTFAAPVIEDSDGQSSPIYFDPALAIGYGYFSEQGSRFTSYEIPNAMPLGDNLFEIHYQGESYPLSAGDSFDFTLLDPAGVDSFLLLGIDETELLDAGDSDPPFTFGMTFAEAGIAEFSTFALFTPEPGDFDRDGDIDGQDFLAWQRDPSVGDLADWQANYGADGSLAGSMAVPEPSGALLVTMYVVVVTCRIRSASRPFRYGVKNTMPNSR